MFDEKTIQELNYYVYMLIDPRENKPFYIGKGDKNRVFDHISCAFTEIDNVNLKYEKIKEIIDSGHVVNHIIVAHGLKETTAYQIEASLIDSFAFCGILLSNKVRGRNSVEKGLMNSDEIIRLYSSLPLNSMGEDCIIININQKYKRGS